jgi:type 1 fimbria pilin
MATGIVVTVTSSVDEDIVVATLAAGATGEAAVIGAVVATACIVVIGSTHTLSVPFSTERHDDLRDSRPNL